MAVSVNGKDNRIAYIDFARAFVMIAIVLFHTPITPNPVRRWLMSFSMPVFFILYGITWKDKSSKGLLNSSIVKNRAGRLIVPYFIWAFFYLVLALNVNGKAILYILYGSQQALKRAETLTSLWFLTCMFVACCLFEQIQSLIRLTNRITSWTLIASAVMLFAGFFVDRNRAPSFGFPWGCNIALLSCGLMLLGYSIKPALVAADGFRPPWKMLILLLSLLVVTISCYLNIPYLQLNNVDMASATYGNPFLFLISAFSGLFMVFAAAQIVSSAGEMKGLRYIGVNTLPIFLIHKPIVTKLSSYVSQESGIRAVFSILIAFGTIVFCCFMASILNKWLPWAVGSKRPK